VVKPGSGVGRGRIKSGARVTHDELDVPVLASHRHGKLPSMAMPDGIGACLLGNAQ
jgi:hypothetical protein